MNSRPVIAFDMDGVLVDVRDSYLMAISQTVGHFTGVPASLETIEQYKESGGWNNDWDLAHELVRQAGFADAEYPQVVSVFQRVFLGERFDGLIAREKWIPNTGLLERLAATNRLAVFSGRPREEIDFTLGRFAPGIAWACIVAEGDVAPKPAPDGLQCIARQTGTSELTYVGDSIDDARSARAMEVSFVGVARSEQVSLRRALQSEGARAVVESVNQLEEILSCAPQS